MKAARSIAGLLRLITPLAMFVALSAPGAALAQAPEQLPLPPTLQVVDANGVDVVGGGFLPHSAEHTIGTKENGIQVQRRSSTAPSNGLNYLRDNLSGAMNFEQYPLYVQDPSKEHMLVTYGLSSHRFKLINGVYEPYKGTDTSFSCSGTICTLLHKDGTGVEYDTALTAQYVGLEARNGLVTKVTKPDGEILTYTYNSDRRRIAVASTLGWMVKTQYEGPYSSPRYQLINTGTDYCDPAAASCEQLSNYPTFTDTTDVMGNIWSGAVGTGGTSGSFDYSTLNYTDPRGVVTSITQYHSGSATLPHYTASISGRLRSVTKGDSTWSYSTSYLLGNQPYAPLGLWRTMVSQPGGGAKQYVYWPEESRLLQTVDELGRTTTVPVYTAAGDPSLVVEPDATYSGTNTDPLAGGVVTGGYTAMAYDSRRNLTEVRKVPRGAGSDHSQDIVWATTYPVTCANIKTCNKPQTITDPRGASTSYTYDPDHGGMLTATKPAVNGVEAQTRYVYQQYTPYIRISGGGVQAQPPVWRLVSTLTCRTMTLASCAGTADELRTTIAYGTNNVLPVSRTVSRGDGTGATTTSITYDIYGNVAVEDGPRAGSDDAVYHFYDLRRLKIGTIQADPDGAGTLPRTATRTTYGSDGQAEIVAQGTVTATTLAALQAMAPLQRTEAAYSTVHGLPVVERRFGTAATPETLKQTSYDANLRVDCAALRMNQAVYMMVLPPACSLGTEGGQGPDQIDRSEYDQTGALLRVVKGYGTPSARAERLNGYDPASGRLAWIEDANGNRSTYEYDTHGRMTHWRFPLKTSIGAHASDPGDYEQYGYDLGSNRTSLRKRDGRTFTFQYDTLNRVTSKVVPDACVSGFSCTSVPAAATRDVFYGYDNLGHPLYTRFDSASGAGITNAFDTLGWLTSSTNDLTGGSRTLGYLYDPYGNRTRITHPDGNYWVFEYDNLNRPVAIRENGLTIVAGIAYDALGRRVGENRGGVATSYGYDSISRLNSISDDLSGSVNDLATTFGYSPASQLVSRVRSNTGYAFQGYVAVNRSYTANGLNQYLTAGPASFTHDTNGNLISDGSFSFSFDAENRLVGSSSGVTLAYDPLGRLYEASGPTMGVQHLLYDGDQLTAEYSNGGVLLRRYIHGPGDDDPLLWYEGAGLTDRRSLQSDHLGSIVSVADASGGVIRVNSYDEYGIPASTNLGKFQFTGQIWLSDLGMYHYKARIYSPSLGRFLQTDPIGYEDQINLYAYVGNDPLSARDPTGTQVVAYYDSNNKILYVKDMDTGRQAVAQDTKSGVERGGPLPRGDYAILEYNSPDPRHEGWFRLEGRDNKFGDDEYKGRTELRLHVGQVSWGCITMCNQTQGRTVNGVIESTSTRDTRVDSKSWFWSNFGSKEDAKDYGTVHVDERKLSVDSKGNLVMTIPGERPQILCKVQTNGICK